MWDSTLPPPGPLSENPGVEGFGSQLPLETHSFIMHDSDPLNSECHWCSANMQKMICFCFGFVCVCVFDIFSCCWSRLKSGWSSMVALHRRKKEILCLNRRFASWNTGYDFSDSFLYQCAPPCHYSLFWEGRKASRKVIYFKLNTEC